MNHVRETPAATVTDWWKRYTERIETAQHHRLRVFVRSLCPPPGVHNQREEIFELLRAADRQGCIDGFTIQVVGKQVCLCDRCRELTPEGSVSDDLLELAEWTDGATTPIGFEHRQVSCSFTNEKYHVLVPPETAVGIYLDGSLAGVFPCAAADARCGVELFLRSLVEGHPPVDSSSTDEPARNPIP